MKCRRVPILQLLRAPQRPHGSYSNDLTLNLFRDLGARLLPHPCSPPTPTQVGN